MCFSKVVGSATRSAAPALFLTTAKPETPPPSCGRVILEAGRCVGGPFVKVGGRALEGMEIFASINSCILIVP